MAAATDRCEEVTVVFVYDRTILDQLEDEDDRRLTFIVESLDQVSDALNGYGSSLITAQGDPTQLIPHLAKHLKAGAVFANRAYEPYDQTRDEAVAQALKKQGIDWEPFTDMVIREPHEVRTQSDGVFKVFTPYSRAWNKLLTPSDYAERVVDPKAFASTQRITAGISGFSADARVGNRTLADLGFKVNDLWLRPGRSGALERLEKFEDRITDYKRKRDDFGTEGTSGLSVHLRHGTISIREAVRVARRHQGEGPDAWLNELVWREFYQMILANFRHLPEKPFKEEFANLEYPGEDRHYKAWEQGETGFPVIDAAMRCFNATGWMHNRLRMIVASFLTKDLLLDYRRGEAYFARKLLDFELASNNGGWQWSASVGVDAQPYFRIFNPYSQSEKFNPTGSFIREWCPELKEFSDRHIHNPSGASHFEQMEAGCIIGEDYPDPVVDHKVQRERAIKLLEKAKR